MDTISSSKTGKTSVCMASYNGEAFIVEQLNSILSEIENDDEVIIVDDASTDRTIASIESINDHRIQIIRNESNLGVCRTFERAIQLARGQIIFLADQDDIWVKGRVALMINALEKSNSWVVASNQTVFGSQSYSTPQHVKETSSRVRNIVDIFMGRANYFGCAMAFKREIAPFYLPFMKRIESHDLWLALLANVFGKITYLEDATLFRRIHGSNASALKRPLKKKLISRLVLIEHLVHAFHLRLRASK